MHDSLMVKEYLRLHGVDNVLDLDHEELEKEYEKIVHEGYKYYQSLINDGGGVEFYAPPREDVVAALKRVQTIDEMYDTCYRFLFMYIPTDLIAFMAELKMPVPYSRLKRIIDIIHARVQDEVLDNIKLDLESLPRQEMETLISHYESMRNNIMELQRIHEKYKSSGTLDYVRSMAEMKLDIVQSFMAKDMEMEYKPFYDNSKEKRTLVSKILAISGIYTKQELFDMKIAELQETYDEIMKQVLAKEREQKLMRKYIEIFEDSAGITEDKFKEYCADMQEELNEENIHEIINYFTTRNHFISNKINNVLSGKDMNKMMSPTALMGDTV
ncbi:hypothetical protein DCO58_05220 [Helicobacter saguini]|uniref:Uncharacterized protein n=1 Tax=Helicobacter saguini TaxID=1548018 RepID=A0A347VT40_9HELI|nr:hypothetical protein [Helicobacter saguini]MWV62250.1 hypothetical protein [Helicobacter saguini]MWV67077.1 hypothetical protein [Helicobacter saguini]MWV69427.1 hypothetical protein [Helicobacter saguini]MWV71019.1 hypothetical protein [Helicobacter saguini]TLD91747.1 hypothetical protein LS64_011345 [Helicobacter saguini]